MGTRTEVHNDGKFIDPRCIASDAMAAVTFISSAVQHLSFGVRPAAILTHGDQTTAVKMELEIRLRKDSSAMRASRFHNCDVFTISLHACVYRGCIIVRRITI